MKYFDKKQMQSRFKDYKEIYSKILYWMEDEACI